MKRKSPRGIFKRETYRKDPVLVKGPLPANNDKSNVNSSNANNSDNNYDDNMIVNDHMDNNPTSAHAAVM